MIYQVKIPIEVFEYNGKEALIEGKLSLAVVANSPKEAAQKVASLFGEEDPPNPDAPWYRFW